MATPNTHYGRDGIAELLKDCRHLFFIGIGGVNMSSLAEISKKRGYRVSGSDHAETPITERLMRSGIPVFLTHSAKNLLDADAVIYTVAVPSDNPEYREAIRRGLPLISRADYLGYIMTGYPRRIGLSGMHGKSTTTSMCAEIFMAAGEDPTVTSGAALRSIGGYYRISAGESFIFEACEYMDSFLDFYPTTAVILNMEMDHVDYFKSMAQIRSSYRKFADKTLSEGNGCVIYNADDENVCEALADFDGKRLSFGVKEENRGKVDFFASDIREVRGRYAFTVLYQGEALASVQLSVPGRHNVMNAIAAFASAYDAGLSPEAITQGLARFCGAERRMEYKGEVNGCAVYDDYGHHPSEVKTTLAGAKRLTKGKLYCLFQPHTYSRTKALFSEFAQAFLAVDGLFLVDIYAAREIDTLGVSSALLAEAIGDRATYCPSFREAAEKLLKTVSEDDLLVVMGAGNVYDIFPLIGLSMPQV
jgi:UDP-N-acetylmuramate--alanine ligase